MTSIHFSVSVLVSSYPSYVGLTLLICLVFYHSYFYCTFCWLRILSC